MRKMTMIDIADECSISIDFDYSEGLLRLVVRGPQAQLLAGFELEPNQAEAVASTLRILVQKSRIPRTKEKMNRKPRTEARMTRSARPSGVR